jgi:RNA polymerase sigma-70 factor (ECF subfamily)
MMGGTASYGALPTGPDLSDLREALLGLGDRAGRIPWARCAGMARAGLVSSNRVGGTEPSAENAVVTAAAGTSATGEAPTAGSGPPGGAIRADGSARSGGSRAGGPGQAGAATATPATANPAEPHAPDPRSGRPPARSLRNPAPRRPVESETGDHPVLTRPPGDNGQPAPGPRHGGPGHGGPGRGGPVPQRRGSHRSEESIAAPGGGDGGDEIWRLVEQAQAGDAQAFARIYDRYFDTVYRYISYRTGSRTIAEDLTSEVWLRALRRIGSVSWQGRDLGAWLVTIARNLIADHYKSGRQRLEVTTADMLDNDGEAVGPESDPAAAVLTRLDNATLLDAVRRLNPEQQECITLRFLQGLSVTETAQIMGKNDGAIKALQYRAVRTLGRLLPEGFTL